MLVLARAEGEAKALHGRAAARRRDAARFVQLRETEEDRHGVATLQGRRPGMINRSRTNATKGETSPGRTDSPPPPTTTSLYSLRN